MNEYNGWTNYETWNVNLWTMNDEGPYRLVCEGSPWTPETARELVSEIWPDGTPDMDGPNDYDKVNWTEIAYAWNEN